MAEFNYNFGILNLRDLMLEKQETGQGHIIFNGIYPNGRKNLSLDKTNGNNQICIKDSNSYDSITAITQNCDGNNEHAITCDGTLQDTYYTCTGMGDYYFVTGLQYSLVQQAGTCLEDWDCTDWGSCSDGTQTRTCTDLNNCGTTNTKPAETQSCSSGDDGGGGDGGGGDGGGGGPIIGNKNQNIVIDDFTGIHKVTVSEGDTITVKMGNKYHTVTVKTIRIDYTELDTPEGETKLTKGIKKYYDFDSNGANDIGILYYKHLISKIELELEALEPAMNINETEQEENITTTTDSDDNTEEITEQKTSTEFGSTTQIIIILVAVIILGVLIYSFVYFINKKRHLKKKIKPKKQKNKQHPIKKIRQN